MSISFGERYPLDLKSASNSSIAFIQVEELVLVCYSYRKAKADSNTLSESLDDLADFMKNFLQ